MTSENPKLFVAWADDLDTHVNDKNNPHGVTAEQLGAATVEEVEEVKKSVSDGKTLVANAITAKGIDTAADAAFATMAKNIEEIVTLENGTEDATATAEQILLDMKAYVKGLPVIGTMPNNGAVSGALNCGGSYKIPKGYHDGNGVITANSLASQTVGTATAAQILSGKTAWANGEKITGTIQSQAAQTITPGTANKTIAAGKYLSGVQTIKGDSNLKAANIKKGVSIFGVAGSCDSLADYDMNIISVGSYYMNNEWYDKTDANLIRKSEGVFQYTFPAKLRYFEFLLSSSTSTSFLSWLVGKKYAVSKIKGDDVMTKHIPLPSLIPNSYASKNLWSEDTTLNLSGKIISLDVQLFSDEADCRMYRFSLDSTRTILTIETFYQNRSGWDYTGDPAVYDSGRFYFNAFY